MAWQNDEVYEKGRQDMFSYLEKNKRGLLFSNVNKLRTLEEWRHTACQINVKYLFSTYKYSEI